MTVVFDDSATTAGLQHSGPMAVGAAPPIGRDQLLALLNSITDEIWFVDLFHRFQWTNTAGVRAFALSEGTAVDLRKLTETVEILRPDGTPRPIAESPPLLALRGEIVRDQEEIVRTPASGELRHRAVNSMPVRDKHGAVVGAVSIVRDVTAQKQAESELIRARTIMAEAEKIAGIGAWEYCVDTQEVHWSEGERQIYGLAPDDTLPNYAEMLRRSIHPDDAADLHSLFGEALRDGTHYEMEHRIVRPDGTVRLVHDRAQPYFDATGSLVRYVGATVDITERRQTERRAVEATEKLQQEKSKLEAAMESMSDCVFIADTCGRLTEINRAFASLHRFGGKDACPTTLTEYAEAVAICSLLDEELPLDQWPASRALRGESGEAFEYSVRRRGTAESWIGSFNFAPMRDHAGVLIGAVVTIRDVTQRKLDEAALMQARVAEQANLAKATFLRTVSHELRTPLNAIIGFSKLMLGGSMGPLQEPQLRPVEIIERSGQQLLVLVQELLDLSCVEAGSLIIRTERVGLRKILVEARDCVELDAVTRGLQMLEIDCDPAVEVRADPGRVAQVVRNLLSNAIKFTDEGTIQLAARLEGGVAIVEVTDTGIGIPTEHQARLFQPFQRIEPTSGPWRSGTGLGLSVSRRLIEMMGGTIGVDSADGHGSRFWFTLPLA